MRYEEHTPGPCLKAYVDAFWALVGRGGSPRAAGTILPDGSVEIVLSFGDPVRSPRARGRTMTTFVVGQMERPWRVAYTGQVDLVGIRLHPAAARVFVPMRQEALANRVVRLATVAPHLDGLLASEIEARPPRATRVARLEQLLISVLPHDISAYELARRAVDRLRASNGRLRVGELAQSLEVTPRRLERVFRRDVGLTPKRWSRVVRFQAVFAASSDGEAGGWAAVAQRLGYADQAHLVREFREFTGRPPGGAWWT
jgi:AraC-like DNA-binding protein